MPKPTPPPALSPNVSRGEWIDLTNATNRTGLSRKTLYRRIKDGTLRAYHVAGTRAVRVNTDDLDALFVPYGEGV